MRNTEPLHRWSLWSKLWNFPDASQKWGSHHLKGHKIDVLVILSSYFYLFLNQFDYSICRCTFLNEIQTEFRTLHVLAAEHPLSIPFVFHYMDTHIWMVKWHVWVTET